MTQPTIDALFPVIDRTWPAATMSEVGPWIIREGKGGGSRVSAATLRRADGEVTAADVASAAAAMTALGQTPLFMIRDGDMSLDRLLETLGYPIKDPVTAYVAPVSAIATTRPPPVTCFETWPPLAIQEEIWAKGGIGPGRLAVMHRAAVPKTAIFGRIDDSPAGTAFVGIDGDIAMLHALETDPAHRRKGMGRYIMQQAGFWAAEHGAAYLALLVTRANSPANQLYTSLGFQAVGHYHYRIKPGSE